jgi:ribosome-binding factor A
MSRIERLNEQFRRGISEILRLRVRDPRVTGVVVTGARVTTDLFSAKILVQLSGDAAERAEQVVGLEAATPYIRGVLGRSLTLRRVPELIFVKDETLANASRIEELLREVRPEGSWEAEAETEEEEE